MTKKEEAEGLNINDQNKNELEVSDEGITPEIQDERDSWTNKREFLLSALGYCVGFGNVWRFPYLCYRNGGATFLIPYFTMLVVNGIPLFFLELAIGQYFTSGVIGVWTTVCPLMRGIGFAICMISFLVCIYYVVIIAWVLLYLFESFRADVPWKHCGNEWNTPFCREERKSGRNFTFNCTQYGYTPNCTFKPTSPSAEYWNNHILQISDGIGEPGDLRWQLFLTFLLAWVMVYFCLFKGVKSSGKVVYFTATFPFIVLFILMIRGATLDGSLDGVVFYLKPDFVRLADPEVWIAAATQIYYSLGVGFGTLITFGSYNKFNNNCHRDTFVIACANCGTSFFAGFVIFSVLGFMALMLETSVAAVATTGPGLAFVVYPEAISQMPLSTLWAILFFFMLLTLGLDSQFGTIEAVITGLADEYKCLRGRIRKPLFVLVLCLAMFILGISNVTQGGMYVFNLMDYQTAGVSLLFLALMEIVTVGWIYGVDRFCDNVEEMTGKRPLKWFQWSWKFISPFCTTAIILANIIQWKGISYNGIPYPSWAEFLGWCMALASMLLIPGFAIYQIWQTPGTLSDRIRFLLRPDEIKLAEIEERHGLKKKKNYLVYL